MKKLPMDFILTGIAALGFCILGAFWVHRMDKDRDATGACVEARLQGKDASESTRQWIWRECALEQSEGVPRPYRKKQ